jgi:hypothetical protein
MEERIDFELFKSNVCHDLKRKGDLFFIRDILDSKYIIELFKKKWYPECLYVLAMVDYLSKENNIPLCNKYDELRSEKMEEIIYPDGVIIMSYLRKSNKPKEDILKKAIPEFLKYNIVELEIKNVY